MIISRKENEEVNWDLICTPGAIVLWQNRVMGWKVLRGFAKGKERTWEVVYGDNFDSEGLDFGAAITLYDMLCAQQEQMKAMG